MRPYRLASTESSEADESSDEEYRRRGITTSYNLSIFNSFFIKISFYSQVQKYRFKNDM